MATLLSSVTTNTTGTGASHSGPCTVFVRGTFDGATVVIQVSDDDAAYVKADNVSITNPCAFKNDGCVSINAYGTYYVRAVLANAGDSTDIDAVSTQ